MSSQLHHVVVQQRAAVARLDAERDRPQRAARSGSAELSYPIVQADPEPTAHPSPEAWPTSTARRRLVVLLWDASGTSPLMRARGTMGI
jgi:hypothetical protein